MATNGLIAAGPDVLKSTSSPTDPPMSSKKFLVLAALISAGATAHAQSSGETWAACRADPKRACILAEAKRSARSLSQSAHRHKAFDEIVRILTEGERLDEALAISASLRQEGASLVVRAELAAALAKAGRLEDANQTAQAIPDPGWRVMAEAKLAESLAATGDLAKAKEKAKLAHQLARSAGQPADFAIRRIATAMIIAGQTDEAVAMVRATGSQHWRLRGLIDVATAISASEPERARKLLLDASKLASSQGDPVWTIYGMRDIALVQAKAGSTNEARATLERAAAVAATFKDQGSRATFLEVIGVGLAEAGLTAEAIALARTINGDWPRVRVASAAGAAAAKAHHHDRAAEAYNLATQAAENGRPSAKPHLHAYIAESEKAAGLLHRVPHSLDRMDKAAALVDNANQSSALAKAVKTRLNLTESDSATTLATISDATVRNIVLKSLVENQVEAGRLDAAQANALSITAPNDQGYTLSLVAAAQAKAGKVAEALDALDAMPSRHYRRVNALAAIAAALEQ